MFGLTKNEVPKIRLTDICQTRNRNRRFTSKKIATDKLKISTFSVILRLYEKDILFEFVLFHSVIYSISAIFS